MTLLDTIFYGYNTFGDKDVHCKFVVIERFDATLHAHGTTILIVEM
jgi:hypothetical protein